MESYIADDYYIAYVDEPAWEVIGKGLREYNAQRAGPELGKAVSFVLYAPDKSIAGGVIGETHWEWLYINLMWIKEELRGCGYGHQLLEAIEQEGRQRGARHAYLDTFTFQAPEFYKKHGYEVFGVLRDFPPGQERIYLTKKL
jgi:GNAT superfamily N-acetyltransferase